MRFWRAAIVAGIVAGAVFIVLEMVLWPVAGLGSPWVPVRMIAAILLGPDVLPPPDSFHLGIFAAAMLLHFSLSALYATIYAAGRRWLLRRRLRRLDRLAPGLFGLVIYLINFYGFVVLFPWFVEARHATSILVHVVWGMILPHAYDAMVEPPAGSRRTVRRRTERQAL